MAIFKPKTEFDRVFEVGILLKGLDGLLETLGGLIMLFIRPERINRLVNLLTQERLSQNSHDLLATHIIHWSQHITRGALIFGAVYLLCHGVAKLVLVVEILRNHLWAYVGLIVLTALFIVYQTYEFIFNHSISLMLLNIFDIFIIYLTIREYQKQLKLRIKTS